MHYLDAWKNYSNINTKYVMSSFSFCRIAVILFGSTGAALLLTRSTSSGAKLSLIKINIIRTEQIPRNRFILVVQGVLHPLIVGTTKKKLFLCVSPFLAAHKKSQVRYLKGLKHFGATYIKREKIGRPWLHIDMRDRKSNKALRYERI